MSDKCWGKKVYYHIYILYNKYNLPLRSNNVHIAEPRSSCSCVDVWRWKDMGVFGQNALVSIWLSHVFWSIIISKPTKSLHFHLNFYFYFLMFPYTTIWLIVPYSVWEYIITLWPVCCQGVIIPETISHAQSHLALVALCSHQLPFLLSLWGWFANHAFNLSLLVWLSWCRRYMMDWIVQTEGISEQKACHRRGQHIALLSQIQSRRSAIPLQQLDWHFLG